MQTKEERYLSNLATYKANIEKIKQRTIESEKAEKKSKKKKKDLKIHYSMEQISVLKKFRQFRYLTRCGKESYSATTYKPHVTCVRCLLLMDKS